MQRRERTIRLVLGLTASVAALTGCSHTKTVIRFGHFNIIELNHTKLDRADHHQAVAAAAIIQRFRPDVLSINEMSYDRAGVNGSTHTGRNVQLFEDHYLSVAQADDEPIRYPHKYFVQGNSGLDSGDGGLYGFGRFEGEFNMALYARYPILADRVRRFHAFLWKDLPGHRKPAGVPDSQRLFDKDFWDVPIDVNGRVVHVLMCHAVVPVFRDENPARNFDSLRFVRDYIAGEAVYAVADGGIQPGERFVLMGDLNADPEDGASLPDAVPLLLNHPRVMAILPTGNGLDTDHAPPDTTTYDTTQTNYRRHTFKFGLGDESAGGQQFQLDYILPSVTMPLATTADDLPATGVFWSQRDTADWSLQRAASDHHFIWADLILR